MVDIVIVYGFNGLTMGGLKYRVVKNTALDKARRGLYKGA